MKLDALTLPFMAFIKFVAALPMGANTELFLTEIHDTLQTKGLLGQYAAFVVWLVENPDWLGRIARDLVTEKWTTTIQDAIAAWQAGNPSPEEPVNQKQAEEPKKKK